MIVTQPLSAENILKTLQTLTPGQSMAYLYQWIPYKLYLTPTWYFHIGKNIDDKEEIWKQLYKVKIEFDRKVKALYPFLPEKKQKDIDTAKKGIAISDILQLTITENNLQLSIIYDSNKYFCSIPIQYFHKILENISTNSISLPHNAIEEIYGETEKSLDEKTKNSYKEVRDTLNRLIIMIK